MIEDSFSAAHQLRGYEGPCENLHGHTWKVQVFVLGEATDRLGMVIDFKKLRSFLSGILKELDHTNLNDLKTFKEVNPTSENVARYIYERVKGAFGAGVKTSKVAVYESPTACATYYEQND